MANHQERITVSDEKFEDHAEQIAAALEKLAADIRAESKALSKHAGGRTMAATTIVRDTHTLLANLPLTNLFTAAAVADAATAAQSEVAAERKKFESVWLEGRESVGRDMMAPMDPATGQKKPSLYPGDETFD